MKTVFTRIYVYLCRRRSIAVLESGVLMFFALFIVSAPVSAAHRLQERSLYMNTDQAGAKTFYRLSFRYMSPDPVGSIEFKFCTDPIPYMPCVTPTGMDISSISLSDQAGETGFAITAKSANTVVLSRTPQVPTHVNSAYTFDNIINPTDTDYAFAVRLKTFASSDATGPQIDFGSVRGQVSEAIEISTQVPPMLIFCLAETVEYNCTSTNNVNYKDMGQLDENSTLTAKSQMAVGTNASGGFVVTANGAPMSAGTSVIDSPATPTASQKGKNQFGFNLVENSSPNVGSNPEGTWTNAVVGDGYDEPNKYKYVDGDVVAYSPNVSLMKKYTVSYIVNSKKDLRAGVYTTTINYIASGRF